MALLVAFIDGLAASGGHAAPVRRMDATMAPIPQDAKSILVYTEADMPAR